MSYGGVALWDPKHGIPHSHDEAIDMEERISEEVPPEYNPAFKEVAKAVQQFAIEASDYYNDSQLGMYHELDEKEFSQPVLWYSEISPELKEFFSAVIIQAAIDNGLVAFYNDLEAVLLPDGKVYIGDSNRPAEDGNIYLDKTLKKWQRKLKKHKKEAAKLYTSPHLPSSNVLIQKAVERIMTRYFKEHNIAVVRTHADELIYVADFERVQVEVLITIKTDDLEDISDADRKVEYSDYCSVYLNDIDKSIKWRQTKPSEKIEDKSFKIGLVLHDNATLRQQKYYHTMLEGSHEKVWLDSMQAIEDAVIRTLDMFRDIYQVSHDLNALFNFAHNRYIEDRPNHPLCSRQSFTVEEVLFLAKLTKQPNFDELVAFYRPLAANRQLSYLAYEAKNHGKVTQKQLEKTATSSDIIELIDDLPEDMLEIQDEVYDNYIAYLNTLDVDAMLSKPPYKDPYVLEFQYY